MTQVTEHEAETSAWAGPSKWRDIRNYLLDPTSLVPDIPEAACELGHKVLSILTTDYQHGSSTEPIMLDNFNSESEAVQAGLYETLLSHLPGVHVEALNTAYVKVTRYSVQFTSSIGQRALHFTRSFVPSAHQKPEAEPEPDRIFYSVATNHEEPLPPA